jgi:hypothetical protein
VTPVIDAGNTELLLLPPGVLVSSKDSSTLVPYERLQLAIGARDILDPGIDDAATDILSYSHAPASAGSTPGSLYPVVRYEELSISAGPSLSTVIHSRHPRQLRSLANALDLRSRLGGGEGLQPSVAIIEPGEIAKKRSTQVKYRGDVPKGSGYCTSCGFVVPTTETPPRTTRGPMGCTATILAVSTCGLGLPIALAMRPEYVVAPGGQACRRCRTRVG